MFLLILLILNIIFVIFNGSHIFIIPTLIKLSLLIIGMFLLFLFKIWHPGYIKYIFVSSLFFLGVGEITFISNIFFLILFYIVGYFFYYYINIIINYKKFKSHILALKQKTQGTFSIWLEKNKKNVTLKIITIIFGFFSIFILIRLVRLYMQGETSKYSYVIDINNIHINTISIIFIGLFIITALLHRLYHRYLLNNYKYLVIIIIGTALFIIYEFIYDYEFISKYIHRIFAFLIFLFMAVWIIIRMGKYLFFDNDSKVINYKDLKTGDIIEKKLISSYLIGQKSLEDDNITDFIKKIENPISEENCDKLKIIIQKNSDFQEKKGITLPPNIIRIYNTFVFSPFIFGSFLITLFIGQNMLIITIFELYKNIIGLGD
ncbi:MAG: hypothetical protein QM490_04050 [Candidatus Gracilibacteria bacterium]